MEEERVKIYLISIKYRLLVILIALAGVSLVICLIVAGSALPDFFKNKEATIVKCENEYSECSYMDKRFTIKVFMDKMNSKNHFIFYEIVPNMRNSEIDAKISVVAYADADNDRKKVKESEKSITFQDGKSEKIAYIPYINYDSYEIKTVIKMEFKELKSFKIKVSFMNADFFTFLIAVKYFFFSLSIISIVIFSVRSRKISIKNWPFESKSSLAISISLIFYNEPLIGAYTLFFNKSYTGLSIFCNIQFLSALLLFWMISLQRPLMKNNSILQVIFFSLEIFFTLGLSALYFICYLHVEMKLLNEDGFEWNKHLDTQSKAAFIAFIVVICIIASWVVFLLIYSIFSLVKRWKTFQAEEEILCLAHVWSIIVGFVFIGLGYFRLMPGGQILLSAVAFFNIYFYVLLWICTPVKMFYYHVTSRSSNIPEIILQSEDIDEKIVHSMADNQA
jgi:hypothetical protein